IFLWAIGSVLYNLLLHPLAHQYPGPLFAQASVLYQIYHEAAGQMPHVLTNLHRQYGPVVRIAPNELSFDDSSAWRDIYGNEATKMRKFHCRGSHGGYSSLGKDPIFYGPGANNTPSILVCSNTDHQRFRKLLNHAFTSRAVMSQQELIQTHLDKLIDGLKEKSHQEDSRVTDLTLWFDSFGLDTISDLTYGQAFGCLEAKGAATPETEMVARSLKISACYRLVRRLPYLVQRFIGAILPRSVIRKRQERLKYSLGKIHERINRGVNRPDVFWFLDESSDKGHMSLDEIASSMSILMAAGSETTATTLAGCVFCMLHSPKTFEELRQEISLQFENETDITLERLSLCPKLTAVINEALRVYPPTPCTLPRRVPPGGSIIAKRHVPPGTVVGVNHWVTHRSPRHFTKPTEFVPKRWLEDSPFPEDDKSAFKPFITGPRNCLGQRLADAELRLVLARLAWNFDLKLQAESEDWIVQKAFTLWSKPPLLVKVSPRKD
ncbi:hypothetical protein N7448_010939, partial [Penicillium atrosanguineum]